MKKSYLFLLASAVLALSACGDTTSNTTTGTNTDETTQTTQDNSTDGIAFRCCSFRQSGQAGFRGRRFLPRR